MSRKQNTHNNDNCCAVSPPQHEVIDQIDVYEMNEQTKKMVTKSVCPKK